MNKEIPTVKVGGMMIAALNRVDTAKLMIELAQAHSGTNDAPAILTSANGQVLSLAARDHEFKRLCETADVVSADGQPMVIASRLLSHQPLPERVATTDLFHDVAKRAEETGLSFYMLGASSSENQEAVASVQKSYPRIKIVGARHGYFSVDQEHEIAESISAARPDILWVALGVPREHQFIARWRKVLRGVGVIKTSGGLFNFLAGSKSRAPSWMQNAGLEWLYRAGLEPRRLIWRYATSNVHAAYLLLHDTQRTRYLPNRMSR